jgi:nucleoside-diphosphate-sugar epimerase
VVHGGTPFQLEVQDPKKELFDPTIKGTENFLETVEKTPGIEKVVFIASIAAQNTNYPFPPGDQSPTDIINEGDEPFMSEESHPYAQAKFMAHQTVEKYVAEHPGVEFEVSTVSPAFVTGRAMSQREDSTSMGLQYLFKNKIAPNPLVQMMYDTNVAFAMVDVEDVAEGVFQAATKTGIHGNNYFLSNESYPVSDISLMLNGKEPEGKPWVVYSNEGARNDLEMEFKPAQQSLNQVF